MAPASKVRIYSHTHAHNTWHLSQLEPKKYWEQLLFLDDQNYGGIQAQAQGSPTSDGGDESTPRIEEKEGKRPAGEDSESDEDGGVSDAGSRGVDDDSDGSLEDSEEEEEGKEKKGDRKARRLRRLKDRRAAGSSSGKNTSLPPHEVIVWIVEVQFSIL